MITFHLITIFPEIFDSYLSEGILQRAQRDGKFGIKVYNLRDFAQDKHRKVDDTPYGGGPGMVLKVEPIFRCLEHIEKKSNIKLLTTNRSKDPNPNAQKAHIILTSAKGKEYTQHKAEELKNFTDIIVICGRYEGVDERVARHIADEEISIGRYVLTGGELPALVIVDSVARLLEGVLGNEESLSSESFSSPEFSNDKAKAPNKLQITNRKSQTEHDYPVYTKPAEFQGWKVPEILQSGNHGEIEKWRNLQKNNPVAQ